MQAMTKWKDLEAQGVRRCCAMFKNGKRCCRRQNPVGSSSYCQQHAWIDMFAKEIFEAGQRAEAQEPSDEDNDEA